MAKSKSCKMVRTKTGRRCMCPSKKNKGGRVFAKKNRC